NTMVGAANNFYPQYFDDSAQDGIMPIIWPINVPREDFEFMWNNDTLLIWESLPFDEVTIDENGNYDVVLTNSTSIDYVNIVISKSTGVTQSFFMLSSDHFMYYQIKTQTLVDWSVNIGDILYFKQNDDYEYGFTDLRITIFGTYTIYVNMTYMIEEFNLMGIPVTLPSGQPEYQFFSYLEGSIDRWDPSTQSWIHEGERPFAIANIYWPISPLSFEMGPPLLMPEGTTSSDLTDIFDMFGDIYDDISYGSGFVTLRNSTLDRTLYFYFDEVSGRVTMMYGWANTPGPGEEWHYLSYYPKFYRALSTGSNSFTMNSDFITDMTVTVNLNVSVGGPTPDYIYNFLPYNPVNVSVPEGTPLAYFDQLITNWMLINGNITMTMTLPPSIDLNDIELRFYAFNMSGTLQWDEAPPEIYNQITYDYGTNSFTIETPPWPWDVISAISYVSVPAEEPIIPGYNVLIFVIGIIVISALILKWKRK
ncbi:MAG: hypothetical protein ACFFHD_16000, partial [Promethearchaeota archaeon]